MKICLTKISGAFLIFVMLLSCTSPLKDNKNISEGKNLCLYAQSFRIIDHGSFKTLEYLTDSSVNERYFVAAKDVALPDGTPFNRIIRVPLKKIAATSVTAFSFAWTLENAGVICGLADTSYLTDPRIKAQELLAQVSSSGQLDYENLLKLQPQYLLASFIPQDQINKLESLGIKSLPFNDFMENDPLGRAEWIKFLALLLDEMPKADSIFNQIAAQYRDLENKVKTTNHKPSVFDGDYYGGIWYVSGNESYMAEFYRDAGADYAFGEIKSSASMPVDFETVFQAAAKTDYWRIFVSGAISYDELKARDERIVEFKAWKGHKVIYCNTMKANYFSRATIQPQEILADFVHIFHPEILPERKNKYFHLLK